MVVGQYGNCIVKDMNSNLKNMTLSKHKLLNKNILFLDGLGRAGKFFLGKIIGGFIDVDYFIYNPIIEHIIQLGGEGVIQEKDASALLSIYLNMSVYDYSLGRNLNTRRSDSSSIFNSFEPDFYLKRLNIDEGISGVKKIIKNNRYSTFMVHECTAYFNIIKKTAPSSKIILIRRNPIDVAYSWYMRGWGERFGTDPLAFIPTLGGERGIPIPVYAKNWIDKYENMNKCERVVSSVLYLMKEEEINVNIYDDILPVYYENLMIDPYTTIEIISNFLEKLPHSSISKIIEKEVRVFDFASERKNKVKILKSKMKNPILFDSLKDYEDVYCQQQKLS
jgi:hypothetical protein